MQKRFPAALMVLAFVAAACAGGPGGGGAEKGEIIIATDFPTSGADRASGRPAEAGATWAILQGGTYKGFKITVKNYDDAVNGVHDPQKGAQNAQDMCANSKVLAMSGPFNSNVGRAMIPVANQCGLTMLSPANTNECLTQTFDYCDPKPAALRPTGKNNYFRIAAPDTVQGPAMADFAVDTLKITKLAVWSDNETFGKGVADNFAKQIVKRGGQVVLRQDFDWKTTNDFKTFIQRAKDAGAQAFYAGAVSGTKGCIPRAQMQGIFTTETPYLGPDGIGDTQCIKDAGGMAQNMYFTNAAADATQDPAQKDKVEQYKKDMPNKEDFGAYTFPAADTGFILVDAVKRAIDAAGGNMPTREQVLTALQNTKDFKGMTGVYSFDKNGDPTKATMAFYQLKGTEWAFVKQFSTGGQ